MGSFTPYSKQTFSAFVFKYFRNTDFISVLKQNFINEVFHFIVNSYELQVTHEYFYSADEYLLNVKNGVLDLRYLTLLPHSPKYHFNYTLKVNFLKKTATPKKFLQFLSQTFDFEEDRELCIESLAYTISNNTSAKKIWFLYGDSNTGKSVLLDLITYMVGENNVSHIPLDKLENRFELSSAINARVNLVGEVQNMKIKETKTLKMITGGDKICIEPKYEAVYYSKLRLKFLLSGNQLPKLEGSAANDVGIKSRFRFLEFVHVIDEADRIGEYGKILYEEEGDDIFYLLVRKLKKFYERGCKFKETKMSMRLSEEFFGRTKNVENKELESQSRITILRDGRTYLL